jgi:hypothetical protein
MLSNRGLAIGQEHDQWQAVAVVSNVQRFFQRAGNIRRSIGTETVEITARFPDVLRRRGHEAFTEAVDLGGEIDQAEPIAA